VFLFGFSPSCVPYVASFSGFPFFIALSVLSNIYFLDIWLLLARKLLNQGFILIKRSDPITYHRVCNTMGATCEAGTAYPSGATEFILGVRAALFFV
jgi:hypothetical protein